MRCTQSKALEPGPLIAWNVPGRSKLGQAPGGLADFVVFAATRDLGVRVDPRLHGGVLLELMLPHSAVHERRGPCCRVPAAAGIVTGDALFALVYGLLIVGGVRTAGLQASGDHVPTTLAARFLAALLRPE